MTPIFAPLNPGLTGAAVSNLHDALTALLDRDLLLGAEPDLRDRLRRELRREGREARYGDVTQRLVDAFQQEQGLSNGGAVDEPTAEALNRLLLELGLLEERLRTVEVHGTARHGDGRPVVGGRVRAEWLPEQQLAGEGGTNDDGQYRLTLTAPDNRPDLAVRMFLFDASGSLLAESPPLERLEPVTPLDFILPQPQEEPSRVLVVHGTARHGDGRPVAGGRVRAEWLPEQQLAGEGGTNDDGQYRLTMTAPDDRPNLAVRVFLFDASGALLAESPPLERLEPVTPLDFILPQPQEEPPRVLVFQGTARHGDGRPVAGGRVRAEWLPEQQLAGEGGTNDDGQYRLTMTAPDDRPNLAVRVFLFDASGALLAESPPLERLEPVTPLDFILPRPQEEPPRELVIQGTARYSAGSPVAGGWLRAEWLQNHELAAEGATDDGGRYRLELVASDDQALRVLLFDADGQLVAESPPLERLEPVTLLDFVLPRDVSPRVVALHGTARYSDGSPVVGGWLRAEWQPGHRLAAEGSTDDAGRYRLNLLASDDQALSVLLFNAYGQQLAESPLLERLESVTLLDHHVSGDSITPIVPALSRPRLRRRYRDYLRNVWVDFTSSLESDAIAGLEARFFQDFSTQDEAARPANDIVVEILLRLLTASNWPGLGINPSTLPVRGVGSARKYLDELVQRTGVSADELQRRHHLDFSRSDAVLSSPVEENIATLQSFFRDGFPKNKDPFPVLPGRGPIQMGGVLGDSLAPFFLWYDEWRQQQEPFWAENLLDIRKLSPIEFSVDNHQLARKIGQGEVPARKNQALPWRFAARLMDSWLLLTEGHQWLDRGELRGALEAYEAAERIFSELHWDLDYLPYYEAAADQLLRRKAMPTDSLVELGIFEGASQTLRPDYYNSDESATRIAVQMAYHMVVWSFYVVPICLGDVHLLLGNYPEASIRYGTASRFLVHFARKEERFSYKSSNGHFDGDLPYTSRYPHLTAGAGYFPDFQRYRRRGNDSARFAGKAEQQLFRLRHGNALLEWADSLFRSNSAASIQRARELYKAVLALHGEPSPFRAKWAEDFDWASDWTPQNPARLAQTGRARAGLLKIEAGLNYYGETDDFIPVLRYRPLKQVADGHATQARSAQDDFLTFMDRIEEGIIDEKLMASHVRAKAAQVAIAEEWVQIAKYDVEIAGTQVEAVEKQIQAKQKEIEEADSLFGQIGAFFGQIGDFVSAPIKLASGAIKGAKAAGLVSGESLKAAGSSLASEAALGVGLGGVSVIGAFASFGALGYASMSSMTDASNRRSEELRLLRDKALPMAQKGVQARQREVRVRELERGIAQSELDLALDLQRFQQIRFLSVGFWSTLAQLARRLMHGYLDLGARSAWLAERALSHELDVSLNIIRLEYSNPKLQDVTAADRLNADLARLESIRIDLLKQSLPVRHTVSLSRHLPLQFAQLKQSGRCSLFIEASLFASAYPGVTDFRIRSVSPMVVQAGAGTPARGVLIHKGLTPTRGSNAVVVRPPTAVPISEFRLRDDQTVFGLPGEVLLPFEGLSPEGFWQIDLPVRGTSSGDIADVLLTFDLWGRFSPERYQAHLVAPPKPVHAWALFSARAVGSWPAQVIATTPEFIRVEVSAGKLPSQEVDRVLRNVALLLVGGSSVAADAILRVGAHTVNVRFENGLVMSNLAPAGGAPPAKPSLLNVLADLPIEQTFVLEIDPAANPDVDFQGVSDLVLAIEYSAAIR
jgi:hypothetical protein